jgi:hypothetical protein
VISFLESIESSRRAAPADEIVAVDPEPKAKEISGI